MLHHLQVTIFPVLVMEPYFTFLQWNHQRPLGSCSYVRCPKVVGQSTTGHKDGHDSIMIVLKLNWKHFYFPKFFSWLCSSCMYLHNNNYYWLLIFVELLLSAIDYYYCYCYANDVHMIFWFVLLQCTQINGLMSQVKINKQTQGFQ